ncbi:hypothetical protein Poli38472_010341 [Pythium oligandrum]|uniref:Large ribosomal subunit protein mL46 n=1 Tax=Pythium oligandrum TaxID=41045 RepID=A0A8K1C2Z6_PYTOL|nr:hypothetical protein Poli38472_010341 [Pythium oligandrum]|eukprot:TMW55459.1 hypothetical protein Poli38472_010341 [Pythium oligandrum]
MLALREGLSTRVSLAVKQTRAFASQDKASRYTWRQKAKYEAAKKDGGVGRSQPPRAKVERHNYLVTPAVDDGKKWRVLSASVLERLPVIQPDDEDWELDFDMMQHEIALRQDQRLEDDFWFMEPGERHITPEEAPWPNTPDNPEDIVGAGFHLAPRETEDDKNDNRKSLNRALKGRVFLIVKNNAPDAKFPWFFPVGEKQDEEKMRDAALRQLGEYCGSELEVYPVGYAPMGYVKYLHDDATKQASGFDGTKVFFYKSQVIVGDVKLNAAHASDYLWVTQSELNEYFEKDVAEYLTKMVPP